MKKEKKIRTYQRRTKSGKLVTVKAHTAKYDAAEHAKELAKKKGAGDELEERKKKKTPQLELPFDKDSEKDILDEVKEVEKKAKKSTKADTSKKETKTKTATKTKATDSKTSEPAFTAAEFKEWYQGTGSAADRKVAKALRAQLGRSGYKKLEDEAIDNYSARGHLSMFKRVSSDGGKSLSKTKNSTKGEAKPFSTVKEIHKATKLDRFENGASLTGKQYSEAVKLLKDSGYRQVKDYLVPPKGKGPLYSVWHNKLSQAGYDDARDLYTGHDILSKSQREIMGSLGYTAFKDKAAKKQGKKEQDAYNAKVTQAKAVLSGTRKRLSAPKLKAIDAELRKSGLTMYQTSTGVIEIYRVGDRRSLKNLVAGVLYNGEHISFGGANEKENKAKYSAILSKVFSEDVDTGDKSHKRPPMSKSKTKKSYTTKRMKPSEVEEITTKRDWIYGD